MKRKELKNLAEKMARFERVIQTSEDEKEKARAQDEIMKLSRSIKSLDDMLILDELIQDILEKN